MKKLHTAMLSFWAIHKFSKINIVVIYGFGWKRPSENQIMSEAC